MESKTYTVEQLTKIGGQLWEQGNMRRVYFNSLAERIGFEYTTYNTGNISSATLNGDRISNSQGRSLYWLTKTLKIWYDLTTGQFAYRSDTRDGARWAAEIIASIEAELAA